MSKIVPLSSADSDALAAELRAVTTCEVRFSEGDRALYATDSSNYRQVPIGVVLPRTIEDVIQTVAVCRKFGAPLLSRGGGTSLAGQCCNVAVIIDFSRYLNKVLAVEPDKKLARVQPGCILDDLRDVTRKSGLTFGPDPATHRYNTLGGMIGNDSCGVHSILAAQEGDGARTADNVESLDILLYDGTRMTVGKTSDEELERIIQRGGRQGEIYKKLRDLRDKYADQIRSKFPDIPRRVSGYCLEQLLPEHGFNVARALVGSEGTCTVVLDATLNLVREPPVRSLVVLGYPDVYAAGDHVPEIIAHAPIGCEGFDGRLVEYMKEQGLQPAHLKLLPPGGGWLMVEFGGANKAESDAKARKCMDELKGKPDAPSMKLFDDEAEERELWRVREAGLGASAHIPGKPSAWPGWEDSAVPPDKVGEYLRHLRKLFDKYGYGSVSIYGHFGQGCLHCRIPFDLTSVKGIADFRAFLVEAAHLVVSLGGSISGEHGDGQARAELLPIMYGDDLVQAFREFKAIWDPQGKMNPGKVVDANLVDQNLRLGAHYSPATPTTHFHFPDDNGDFSKAMERCVGVGLCRRHEGGTMCPSYMVTHEEKHSTRGRARLLFEMLQGNPLGGGWRNESVKEALDLCLACKGCKGDCPVHVDMATYKAEFLSHYYEGRLRPRHAYAFGLIPLWARLANRIPGVAALVNLVGQAPGLSVLAKKLAGMAPQRKIPPFAAQTFLQWWAQRPPRNIGKPKALLWPDTFNNYFHANTAIAAVEVLEAAGWHVVVPTRPVCCGRPLYDYGFLDTAKRWLENVLEVIRADIQNGTPVVVLEPSCAAVFRDELVSLLPHDEDAKRLSHQTFLLSEFLQKQAADFKLPHLPRQALLHGHCHHKAIFKMADEVAVLRRMGLDLTMPEDGCCGMAGAFGFEDGEHCEVAQKCGERVLLPKVRDASADTLLIANGFSCREMISQNCDRHALHLADVIKMALQDGPEGPEGGKPEQSYLTIAAKPTASLALGVLSALIIAGLLARKFCRRRD